MAKKKQPQRRPGVCVPWEEKVKEWPPITGDAQLVKKVWEDVDAMAYTFVWHCVVSF
jgi:hypothetical protein